MDRINRQNQTNTRRRNQTITNIKSHCNQVFTNHMDSANDLNDFLKANYDMFRKEREADHFQKMQNFSD